MTFELGTKVLRATHPVTLVNIFWKKSQSIDRDTTFCMPYIIVIGASEEHDLEYSLLRSKLGESSFLSTFGLRFYSLCLTRWHLELNVRVEL